MKKLLLGLLLILLPFSVKAQTVLDNYKVEIDFNQYEVTVKEEFDVLEADNKENNFGKETYNVSTLTECNMEKCYFINEKYEYPYLNGTIFSGNHYAYQLHYNSYDLVNNIAYIFNAPEDTIINHLTFKVNCNEDYEWCRVEDIEEGTYEVTEDGNITIGEMIQKEGNLSFTVKGEYIEPYEEIEESNPQIFDYDIMNMGSDKGKLVSGIIFVFTILIGVGILFLWKTNKKEILLFYAILILALVILQYAIKQPFLLFLIAFYGFFYFIFYSKSFKDNLIVEIIVFAFLTFHSYFFFGVAVGIIPHILNNLSIFVSAKVFRNNFYKKKSQD